MVLFVLYKVLTFESADEILWCVHSNETSSAVVSHVLLFLSVVPTFESVYEILWYDHSNETSSVVRSYETICLLVFYRKKYGHFSWFFFQVGHF